MFTIIHRWHNTNTTISTMYYSPYPQVMYGDKRNLEIMNFKVDDANKRLAWE
jgi:hypothetical protein